jgi:hypothetical protein
MSSGYQAALLKRILPQRIGRRYQPLQTISATLKPTAARHKGEENQEKMGKRPAVAG